MTLLDRRISCVHWGPLVSTISVPATSLTVVARSSAGPTVVFQAKDRSHTQGTRTLVAVKRCGEPLGLDDVPELGSREGGDRLELAFPIGIVRGRSFNRFHDLAWAPRKRMERIAEHDIFASREHLEHGPCIAFEECAEPFVVALRDAIEALHLGSLHPH